MRTWMLLVALMIGCGNKPGPTKSPANNTSLVAPRVEQPTRAVASRVSANKTKPNDGTSLEKQKNVASVEKRKVGTSVEKPLEPALAEAVEERKNPCAAGQDYEKSTGRCISPTPATYTCVNETQIYDWSKRRCRARSFREWCEAPDNVYEISLTVGKVLNTLGARDCNEAEQKLMQTNVLSFPPGGQKISNVTPLASLTHLTGLYLPENHIVDIAPLAMLKNLQALSLRGNDIQDISPLLELPNLKRLDVAGNPIADWSVLSQMKQLLRVSTTAPTQKSDAG